MPDITKIENIDKLIAKLEDRRRKSLHGDFGSVVVGFNAKYAVLVHEMIPKTLGKGIPRTGKRPDGSERTGKWWDPQGRGRPKYLEEPARELNNSGELSRVIVEAYKGGTDAEGNRIAGATLLNAVVVGALRIQREAQELVPADLGNLKGSAFTEKELDSPIGLR